MSRDRFIIIIYYESCDTLKIQIEIDKQLLIRKIRIIYHRITSKGRNKIRLTPGCGVASINAHFKREKTAYEQLNKSKFGHSTDNAEMRMKQKKTFLQFCFLSCHSFC